MANDTEIIVQPQTVLKRKAYMKRRRKNNEFRNKQNRALKDKRL